MSSLTTKVSGGPNWFGISMVLMGVIIGWTLNSAMESGSLQGGSGAKYIDPPAKEAAKAPAAPSAKSVTPPGKDDYIRGNENAEITIIEWSDYECPFCARHHPTVQALVDEYDGKVNWVYRHFPLSFHPNAQPTAEAAECAGEQGGSDAFWAFTDAVFDGGANPSKFADYAAEAGVDAGKLQDCVDSGKYAQKVKDQMADGQKSGVSGTPGNVIYNNKTKESRLLSGAQPVGNFKPVIDELLK